MKLLSKKLLVVSAAALVACSPKLRTAPELKAPQDEATIARGDYLVHNVLGCAECHSPRNFEAPGSPLIEGQEFSGGLKVTEEDIAFGDNFPGTLQAPNISQDPDDGIGAWSDGEIARAVREGVSRDGHALFPLMPYPNLRVLSDEDTLAVVAYLRTVPPRKGKTASRDLNFPLNLIVNTIPAPLEAPVSSPGTDAVSRGAYLVTVAGCQDCHSPQDKGEPIKGEAFSGGSIYKMISSHPGLHVPSNITPDAETGIGNVTEDQFVEMLREGKGKDGRPLDSFMPWLFYGKMTDADLKAIYAYLRTVAPVRKDVSAILAKAAKTDD